MTNEELFAYFEAYRKVEIRGELTFALETAQDLAYVQVQADHAMAVLPDRASFRMMEYIAQTASAKGEWNDLPLYLDAVTLTMNDREALDKDDYALIKSCGLRCRGRGQWPQLRRRRMGCVPWYLDDEDRALLGEAMRAVCRIAVNGSIGPEDVQKDGQILVASPAGGSVRWEEAGDLSPKEINYPICDVENELELQRLKHKPRLSGDWDVSVQAFPFPSQSEPGGVPRYPMMMILVDEASDMVLDITITEQWEGEPYLSLARTLLEKIAEHGRPAHLLCANARTLMLLGTLCGKIGVPARQESDLPQLYEALNSMLNFMQEHPDGDE